jgi:hypothetical protein
MILVFLLSILGFFPPLGFCLITLPISFFCFYLLPVKKANKNVQLSFTSKWRELESIILSEVSLRRPKISCSPSYADYRTETNAIILLDMGYTLRGEHAWEEKGKGKGRKPKT